MLSGTNICKGASQSNGEADEYTIKIVRSFWIKWVVIFEV